MWCIKSDVLKMIVIKVEMMIVCVYYILCGWRMVGWVDSVLLFVVCVWCDVVMFDVKVCGVLIWIVSVELMLVNGVVVIVWEYVCVEIVCCMVDWFEIYLI